MTGRPAWTAEALWRAALDALGAADGRARDALARGIVVVEPGVAEWESSLGHMVGHRVHLFLEPRTLGTARAAPAVEDALRAALAAALASRPLEALEELVLRCAPPARAGAASPYRDAPDAAAHVPEAVREALVEYLVGSGDDALAARVARAEVTLTNDGGACCVRLPRSDYDVVRRDARAGAALTRALRDLAGTDAVRVSIKPLMS